MNRINKSRKIAKLIRSYEKEAKQRLELSDIALSPFFIQLYKSIVKPGNSKNYKTLKKDSNNGGGKIMESRKDKPSNYDSLQQWAKKHPTKDTEYRKAFENYLKKDFRGTDSEYWEILPDYRVPCLYLSDETDISPFVIQEIIRGNIFCTLSSAFHLAKATDTDIDDWFGLSEKTIPLAFIKFVKGIMGDGRDFGMLSSSLRAVFGG